jgi:hypothetical protein
LHQFHLTKTLRVRHHWPNKWPIRDLKPKHNLPSRQVQSKCVIPLSATDSSIFSTKSAQPFLPMPADMYRDVGSWRCRKRRAQYDCTFFQPQLL